MAGSGWKYGCGGCLTLGGVAVLVAATVVGVVGFQMRTENLTRTTSSPQSSAAPDAAAGIVTPPPGGRVVLDLYHAEVDLGPAAPGERLRVEASYDRRSYELTESYDAPGTTGWNYEARLTAKRPTPLLLLGKLMGANRPRLTVRVPADEPVALVLRTLRTEVRADLGGLWLTSVELECAKAPVDLAFGEGLRTPVERLTLDTRLADVAVLDLGNASPRDVRIDTVLGDVRVDLHGAWREDAAVRIRTRIGALTLTPPDDVAVEGLASDHVRPAPPAELERPTVRLDVSADTLRVVR